MGLVVHVRGDLTDLVTVFAGMVGTEEEFTTGLEAHPKIGLRTTPVATVKRGQRLTGGSRCGHVQPPLPLGPGETTRLDLILLS